MIHMVLAFLMLSATPRSRASHDSAASLASTSLPAAPQVLPALELIVLLWDAHSFAPAIRACSPWARAWSASAASRLPLGYLSPLSQALAWSALAAVRLLHIGCIAGCLNYFLFFFYSGFLNPNFASSAAFYKGFWAEFAAARMFAQLMILAAAASWFVPHYQQDGSPLLFDERPLAGRAVAVAVAAAHGASFGRFALRSAWKSLRNLEYSEAGREPWRGLVRPLATSPVGLATPTPLGGARVAAAAVEEGGGALPVAARRVPPLAAGGRRPLPLPLPPSPPTRRLPHAVQSAPPPSSCLPSPHPIPSSPQALQSTLTADGSGPEGLAAQLCRLLRGGSRGPPEASPPERQRAGGQQGSRPGEAGRSGAEGGLTMLRRQLSWARQFRGALKMHDE